MAKTDVHYENNPFMIGIEGLKLFFGQSRNIALYSIAVTVALIVAVFIAIIGAFMYGASLTESELNAMDRADATAWQNFVQPDSPDDVLVPIAREVTWQFAALVISLLLFGVLDYAAARNAKGEKADLRTGFKTVIVNFPAYLWMYLLMSIKLILWTLLFIIPGIIMFYRYILAGTVFFAEGKRGNAAIKRSSELTKGRWLTTFAGISVWPIISQGLGYYVFIPGSLAVLYRQYTATDSRQGTHIFSWLTLLVPVALIALCIVLTVLFIVLLASVSTAP